MSWILGCSGASLSRDWRERLAAVHPRPLHAHDAESLYLAAGGLDTTCLYGSLDGDGEMWCAVGLGLRGRPEGCTPLGASDWQRRLGTPDPDACDLDGHFVAIRCATGRLEAYTDPLGVRTLYFAETQEGVLFSTRLDWLARLTGRHTLDLDAFGTHWLTFNQLSTGSLVDGIGRLGPGGYLRVDAGGVAARGRPWLPDLSESSPDGSAFERALLAFVRPDLPVGHRLSLGLSGGLDSRLLLALRGHGADLGIHVFGPDAHPDVRVAQRIAGGEGFSLSRFEAPVPDQDACLELLRGHVAQTQAVSAASAVLGLRYYPELQRSGSYMIDGGLGEAARRQFMNRLYRAGRSALHDGDPRAILPHLRVARADVFTRDVMEAMEAGARRQIEALWTALPSPRAVGAGTFLDLLGIRTRLPNFFGYEQNRLDGLIPCYMPFAQPTVLQAVVQTREALRRDGRLFRRLIRSHRPTLQRYPLVKGGVTYPYRLPTVPAYAWTKAKSSLGMGYVDRRRRRFLETLRPFVLDLVHSHHVSSYSLYDTQKVRGLVEGYYEGDAAKEAAVDWWLAFEMWRQSLENGTAP